MGSKAALQNRESGTPALGVEFERVEISPLDLGKGRGERMVTDKETRSKQQGDEGQNWDAGESENGSGTTIGQCRVQ